MRDPDRPALWLLLHAAFALLNTLAFMALDAPIASMLAGGGVHADPFPVIYLLGGAIVGGTCGFSTVLWATRWQQRVLMALCSFCVSVSTVCLTFGFRGVFPFEESMYPIVFSLPFFVAFPIGLLLGGALRAIEAFKPVRKWVPIVEMVTCLLLIPVGRLSWQAAATDLPPDAQPCVDHLYGYSATGTVGDMVAARGSFVRINKDVGAKFLLSYRPVIGGGRQQVHLLPIAQFDYQCSMAMPVIVLERQPWSLEPWTVAEVRKAVELDPSLLDVARTPQLITTAQRISVKAVKAPAVPLK